MHFGITLDSSDKDLWNIDFLDTYLDLLDTDIPSKHLLVFTTSWECLQDMSSTRLQDVFSVTILRFPRCFQMFPRCFQMFKDVSKTSCEMSWRRLEDVLENEELLRWRRVDHVFKACLEDALKTSWRPTNVCWETRYYATLNEKIWVVVLQN